MTNILVIKELFGEFTGLRHSNVSEKSGEDFYHTILNNEFKKSVENKDVLTVDLDGIRGYSPSFIDEAFGKLVYDFGAILVKKHLIIKSDDKPYWINAIEGETFLMWENRRKNKKAPIITEKHSPWWAWDGKSFIKVDYDVF